MRKINNFAYVPNVQHGACLLFDRKGLGRYQSWEFINKRLVTDLPYQYQMLQQRITKNIKQIFSAAM